MSAPLAVGRIVVIALLLAWCATPAVAQSNWLFTPFVGGTFSGSTALVDLEQGSSSSHFVWGGEAGFWSPGILGVEADFGYVPGFFETNSQIVTSSKVFTLGVDLVVATPLRVSRESLRPYLIGGLGWMHSSKEEVGNVIPDLVGGTRNLVGVNFGGGAVGFFSPRTGVRFEIRQFRSLERANDPFTLERMTLLSFWRATVGVVIRR